MRVHRAVVWGALTLGWFCCASLVDDAAAAGPRCDQMIEIEAASTIDPTVGVLGRTGIGFGGGTGSPGETIDLHIDFGDGTSDDIHISENHEDDGASRQYESEGVFTVHVTGSRVRQVPFEGACTIPVDHTTTVTVTDEDGNVNGQPPGSAAQATPVVSSASSVTAAAIPLPGQQPGSRLPAWLLALLGVGVAGGGGAVLVKRHREAVKESNEKLTWRPGKGFGAKGEYEDPGNLTGEVASADGKRSASAGLGTFGKAETRVSAGDGGVTLYTEAEGLLGAKGTAEAHTARYEDPLDIGAKGQVKAGLMGELKSDTVVSAQQIASHQEIGALLGVKTKGELSGRLSGVSIVGEASVSAGVGGEAGAAFDVSWEHVAFEADAGLTAGLGVGGKTHVDIDLRRTGTDLMNTGTAVQELFAPPPSGSRPQ